jgi:hypothetical protein
MRFIRFGLNAYRKDEAKKSRMKQINGETDKKRAEQALLGKRAEKECEENRKRQQLCCFSLPLPFTPLCKIEMENYSFSFWLRLSMKNSEGAGG